MVASVVDDAADGFALVHQVEGAVNVFERHGVGDEVVEAEFAVEVLLDDAGQFAAPFDAAEGRAGVAAGRGEFGRISCGR